MTDLLKALIPLVPYLVGLVVLAVALLAVGFTVNPKRTRKTVDYLLNTFRLAKAVKSGDVAKPLEVPDFETKTLPKVPNPRANGEAES